MKHIIFEATVLLTLLLSNCQNAYSSILDVTDKIQYVGTPYMSEYPTISRSYARNIWDIIAFQGKLYMGAGNSSNSGPAANAGPVSIVSYDPETAHFTAEYTVNEEQIDVFYEFDGRIYVPGHDPKGNWNYGNLYIYTPHRTWEKHRAIPNAIHTYALAYFQNNLFAAIGTRNKQSVAISKDYGNTWRQVYIGIDRIYNFLQVNKKLYAIGTIYSDSFAKRNQIVPNFSEIAVYELKLDNSFSVRKDLSLLSSLFPDTDQENFTRLKVSRSITYGTKSIYIGAKVHNDHQSLPFGVYVASSLEKNNVVVEKIPLPPDTVPWDILILGRSIYILLETKGKYGTEVSVICSDNAKDWHKLFFFKSTRFARSFAILNDYIYFGLGSVYLGSEKMKGQKSDRDVGKLLRLRMPLVK